MSSEPRELEAKFLASEQDHDVLRGVDRIVGFSLTHANRAEQRDTYYDTAELHLFHLGASLRVREKNERRLLTFKADRQAPERGIFDRLEDEVPLEGAGGDTLPSSGEYSPLRRAEALTGGATLLPIAVLVNDRESRWFSGEGGSPVVELTLDHCRATRLLDQQSVIFYEVELEAQAADRNQLRELVRELQRLAPGLTPGVSSKLDFVLSR
jgi:inorganic triphosphatase YgiF